MAKFPKYCISIMAIFPKYCIEVEVVENIKCETKPDQNNKEEQVIFGQDSDIKGEAGACVEQDKNKDIAEPKCEVANSPLGSKDDDQVKCGTSEAENMKCEEQNEVVENMKSSVENIKCDIETIKFDIENIKCDIEAKWEITQCDPEPKCEE